MGPARARTRRRQLAAIIAVAATVSPVFNVLTSRATVAEAVQGVVDATLVGLLVGVFLLFVRDGAARGWFQRLGFRTDLILISAAVLALFLVGRAAGQVVTSLEPHRFPASFVDPHLRYALPFFAVLAVAVLFVLQMNRMIGANALGYFMAGTYQRPTSEDLPRPLPPLRSMTPRNATVWLSKLRARCCEGMLIHCNSESGPKGTAVAPQLRV